MADKSIADYPWERFTPESKLALAKAQEEAERLHAPYIGTEHLLLGVMIADATERLWNLLGVDVSALFREVINFASANGDPALVQQIIPTSRVKAVIEAAFAQADALGSPSVGSEHLLLGILVDRESVATHFLTEQGADLEAVQSAFA